MLVGVNANLQRGGLAVTLCLQDKLNWNSEGRRSSRDKLRSVHRELILEGRALESAKGGDTFAPLRAEDQIQIAIGRTVQIKGRLNEDQQP